MIRVVLDTNIIVSALLQPLGSAAQVFMLALGFDSTVRKREHLAEYEEVISRPRFQRSAEITAGALHAIREQGFWVRPAEQARVCSDPDDDIFLECAQAARAEYLVTGISDTFPRRGPEPAL